MRKTILLAGPSAGGKSTLSRALAAFDRRVVVSTSAYLRAQSSSPVPSPTDLFRVGQVLDDSNPGWLYNLVTRDYHDKAAVVDAVRSVVQANSFSTSEYVTVNVVASVEDLQNRHQSRGTRFLPTPFLFTRPDFTWDSSRVSLNAALAVIEQLSGSGHVDLLIGGQYGSEGKGKLAALLAPRYDLLVRSGGPNAGHWVRDDNYEFCFHHIPSGALANKHAVCAIAAGATLNPENFLEEVSRTGTGSRLWVDPNTVLIEPQDIKREQELIGKVGSTAQGVGAVAARRILRGLDTPVRTAAEDPRFKQWVTIPVARRLARQLEDGARIMVEGTQGSALSLFHGPYPFTTSRDTNTPGLLSEVGLPPSCVRDTWMVLRSLPIRVGGNSGPMSEEMEWQDVAGRAGKDTTLLKSRERTSTTNRQRRVSEFNWVQFSDAVRQNRPTKIFLSFADYIDPTAEGVRRWGSLPDSVHQMVGRLESESGALVAGVSTGMRQTDVAWRTDPCQQ